MSLELIELEPLPGRRVAIEAELSVGRQDCDVTISTPQVSRRHALVAPAGDGAEVTDLGSRNGTFVNDERVAESHALAPGDRLRIGETTWEVARIDAAVTELDARGDVPAPPPAAAVPESPPPPPPVAPAAAGVAGYAALEENPRPSASAARRVEATLICYAVVVLTAIAVVSYLAAR